MTIEIVLALGIVCAALRVRKGCFKSIEWLLLATIALNTILVHAQLVATEGKFVWISRYHTPVYIMSFGWLAWGIREYAGRLRLRLVVTVAIAVLLCYNVFRIVRIPLGIGNRAARAKAAHWAAERIRADWKGPAMDEERNFTVREYISRRRPSVMSDTALPGYLSGGRYYWPATDFDGRPDYALFTDAIDVPAGMEEMERAEIGKHTWILYRRSPVQHRSPFRFW